MKDITTKVCSKCKQIKTIDEFHFRTDSKTYRNNCKLCKHISEKEFYIKNRQIINIKHKKYKENNKLLIRQQNKEYAIRTRADRNAYMRKYRKLNIHKHNNRKKIDPIYKLIYTQHIRVAKFFKLSQTNRICKSLALFGCSFESIKIHLEKQFRDGMTWENHGKVWHIDHIIPLNWFKENNLLEDTTGQILAFHWGNLQPLFVKENMTKSDNLPQKTNFKYFN